AAVAVGVGAGGAGAGGRPPRAARRSGSRIRVAALWRRRLRVVDRRALRSAARGERQGVTLGILYHMPFWQTADGTLWEAEGSFARYVDSIAPYFDRVILAVPVFDTPPASGSRLRA